MDAFCFFKTLVKIMAVSWSAAIVESISRRTIPLARADSIRAIS
jgi:hypothetical protein